MVSEQAAAPPTVRRKAKRNFRPLIAAVVVAALAGGGWWGWVKTHPAEDANSKLLTDTVNSCRTDVDVHDRLKFPASYQAETNHGCAPLVSCYVSYLNRDDPYR